MGERYLRMVGGGWVSQERSKLPLQDAEGPSQISDVMTLQLQQRGEGNGMERNGKDAFLSGTKVFFPPSAPTSPALRSRPKEGRSGLSKCRLGQRGGGGRVPFLAREDPSEKTPSCTAGLQHWGVERYEKGKIWELALNFRDPENPNDVLKNEPTVKDSSSASTFPVKKHW